MLLQSFKYRLHKAYRKTGDWLCRVSEQMRDFRSTSASPHPGGLEPLEPRVMLSADLAGFDDDAAPLDATPAALVETHAHGDELVHVHELAEDDTADDSDGAGLYGADSLAAGEQVLHLRVDFDDLTGDPLTTGQAESSIYEAGDFLRDASREQLWFDHVEVTDTYRMPYATDHYADNGVAGAVELMDHAMAAAEADGFDFDDYWSHALSFDWIASFGWAGLAWVGGPGIWLNGYGDRAEVAAHEFGHNLGAFHSAWWQVDDGDPLSDAGTLVEYGDVFDVMGWPFDRFPDNPFNTYWKSTFGWLDTTAEVMDVTEDRTYRLHAHDVAPGMDETDRTYALRLPGPNDADYWIEYRQSPLHDPADAEIEIRLSPSQWSGNHTLMIDTSGKGETPYDAPLGIGETFTDGDRDLAITPMQAGVDEDGHGWVDVRFGEAEAFTVTAASNPADATEPTAEPHAFTVTYTADVELDTQTLIDNDEAVRVIGPDGFDAFARYAAIDDGENPNQRQVSYELDAPGDEWGEADNGVYTVRLESGQVADVLGHFADGGELGEFEVAVDTTPPESELQLLGELGNEPWFVSPIEVVLSATDELSDIDHIEYRLDEGDWTVYGGSFTVGTPGTTRLDYRAFDTAGNEEPIQSADMWIDVTPPQAIAQIDDVVEPAAAHLFTVTYTDDLAVDVDTILDNHAAVRVTGPDDFDASAAFVSMEESADGAGYTVTYRIDAPQGQWQDDDNGVYTAWIQAAEIADAAGNAVDAGELASFEVDVNTTPPEAVVDIRDVTESFGIDHTFTVTYTDTVAVDIDTLLDNDQAVRITGPNGFDQLARAVAIDSATDGTPRTVTYRIDAPEGGWQVTHSGSYTAHLQSGQVADIDGNFADGQTLGTFNVDLGTQVVIGPDSVRRLTYTDPSGTDVTVRLTGGEGHVLLSGADLQQENRRGHVTVVGAAEIEQIALSQTGLRDALRIQGRGGDGAVTVGAIIGEGDLGRLVGPAVAITGHGIAFDGTIHRVQLGNVGEGAGIRLSGDDARAIHLRFGEIGEDVAIASGSPIRSLTATAWASGSLEAPSVNRLHISGDRRADLAGDMGADITLTGSDFRHTLGQAKIAGGIAHSTWSLHGDAGQLRLNDVTDWSLTLSDGGVRALMLGRVADATVTVDGHLFRVRATDWSGGSLEAGFVRGLQTTGDRRAGIAGDFDAELKLTDNDVRLTLANARINGTLASETWQIVGDVGTIRAGDVEGWSLEGGGDVRMLMLDRVSNGRVAAAGDMGQVRVTDWSGGSIEAGSLRGLQTTGDRRAGITGDFDAELTLTDGDARMTLANARINGTLASETWQIAGDVGAIRAGDVDGWSLEGGGDVRMLMLDRVSNGRVVTAGDVGQVRVTDWSGGSIEAESLRGLQTTGDRRAGITGDFDAELTLTDGDARMTLANARINGTLASETWQIAGDVGMIRAGDVSGWTLEAERSVRAVNLGQVSETDLEVGGRLGMLRAVSWSGGSITADAMRLLHVRGDVRAGVTGDFDAEVQLNDADARQTLGRAQIQGTLAGGAWQVAGSVGAVTADRVGSPGEPTFSFVALGDVGVLRTGTIENAGLEMPRLRTLMVRGDVIDSTLHLTEADGPAVHGAALGRAVVNGVMERSGVRASGSVGQFIAGAMHASTLFVGLDNPQMLTEGQEVTVSASASLGRLQLRGVNGPDAAAFDRSQVAVGSAGQINLGRAEGTAETPATVAAADLKRLHYERPDGSRVRVVDLEPGDHADGDLMIRIL